MTYIILLTISLVLVAVAFAVQNIIRDYQETKGNDKLFDNEYDNDY